MERDCKSKPKLRDSKSRASDRRESVNIDNDGDGRPEIVYEFDFNTRVRNPESFLYNTGPITSLDSPNWNRRQFYSVTRVAGEKRTVLPFQHLHLIPTPDGPGVDATKNVNVHTIAIRVPITALTRDGFRPADPLDSRAVIGVWGSASRRKSRVRDDGGDSEAEAGPWVQVSRLANPLFNEVIVPMGRKDRWNALPPLQDSEFIQYVQHPELARLLPVLYPGVFPQLAAYSAP